MDFLEYSCLVELTGRSNRPDQTSRIKKKLQGMLKSLEQSPRVRAGSPQADPLKQIIGTSKYPEDNLQEELNRKNKFEFSSFFQEAAKEVCESVELAVRY